MTAFENTYTVNDICTKEFVRFSVFTSPRKAASCVLMTILFILGIFGIFITHSLRYAVLAVASAIFFIKLYARYTDLLKPARTAMNKECDGDGYKARINIHGAEIKITNLDRNTSNKISLKYVSHFEKSRHFILVYLFNGTMIPLYKAGFITGTETEFTSFIRNICRENGIRQTLTKKK